MASVAETEAELVVGTPVMAEVMLLVLLLLVCRLW